MSDPLKSAPFDKAVADDLHQLVGAASLAAFFKRLDAQLTEAFLKPPQAGEELRALRYQAHALASTSGMLGFARLSAACVELETEIDREGATAATTLGAFADALAAKNEARAILADLAARPEYRVAS